MVLSVRVLARHHLLRGLRRGAGFGISAFLRDGEDAYQTYFSTDRGGDKMRMDFMLLDITVFGRQESWEDSPAGWPQTPPYTWWRLHDEY